MKVADTACGLPQAADVGILSVFPERASYLVRCGSHVGAGHVSEAGMAHCKRMQSLSSLVSLLLQVLSHLVPFLFQALFVYFCKCHPYTSQVLLNFFTLLMTTYFTEMCMQRNYS